MFRLTPRIQGRFFYFLGPCVMLWKNGRTDFHEVFYEMSGTPQEVII